MGPGPTKVRVDLDDLNKARNPWMTQRATKRLQVLPMWCDPKQEKFVNRDLFQTTTTELLIVRKFVSCHVMSFYSFKLPLLSLKST